MRVEGGNAIMEQGIEIRRGDEDQERGRTRRQRERDERCERAWADYEDEGHEYKSVTRCAREAGVDPKSLRLWMQRHGKKEWRLGGRGNVIGRR